MKLQIALVFAGILTMPYTIHRKEIPHSSFLKQEIFVFATRRTWLKKTSSNSLFNLQVWATKPSDCTGHITTGSWKGRGNQYIQFVRVLYCKLPTSGKQLPAFPLEAVLGIEPWPQRWEARVLPLCHRGPTKPSVGTPTSELGSPSETHVKVVHLEFYESLASKNSQVRYIHYLA